MPLQAYRQTPSRAVRILETWRETVVRKMFNFAIERVSGSRRIRGRRPIED
jgi:hypothetical protein